MVRCLPSHHDLAVDHSHTVQHDISRPLVYPPLGGAVIDTDVEDCSHSITPSDTTNERTMKFTRLLIFFRLRVRERMLLPFDRVTAFVPDNHCRRHQTTPAAGY